MPVIGHISPKARRCLENLSVCGACTAVELNTMDPSAPDHRTTIKNLEQQSYVVSDHSTNPGGPARYTLTEKAKRLLAGRALQAADKKPKATPERRSFANPQRDPDAAPTITHGSMTTGRMVHPCADMLAPATRAGAERALQIPSRVNDTLHYRDGRMVQITTNQRA